MSRYFIAVLLIMASSLGLAQDNGVREYVVRTSILSYAQQVNPTPVWLSTFSAESKPVYFTNSSGLAIVSNPSSVVSAYDATSTRYSTSNFYALKSDRYKFISHINGFSKGEVFSIGYDTGINTQKLNMTNAFFVGYTKTFSLAESALLNFSLGGWFGGGIHESPCVDSYGRQYSCQTLTAWQDYNPNYPKSLSFLDLKFVWLFN